MNRHQFSSKQKIQLSSSCATKAAPPLLILKFGSFCGFEDFCSIFYFLFFFNFFFGVRCKLHFLLLLKMIVDHSTLDVCIRVQERERERERESESVCERESVCVFVRERE